MLSDKILFYFSFLTMTTDPEEQKKLTPLMLTNMFLVIPKISIKPTLEEIQASFSKVLPTYHYDISIACEHFIQMAKQSQCLS